MGHHEQYCICNACKSVMRTTEANAVNVIYEDGDDGRSYRFLTTPSFLCFECLGEHRSDVEAEVAK